MSIEIWPSITKISLVNLYLAVGSFCGLKAHSLADCTFKHSTVTVNDIQLW